MTAARLALRYVAVVLDGLMLTRPPIGWRCPDPRCGGDPHTDPSRRG